MQSKPTYNRSKFFLYALLWLFFAYLYFQILILKPNENNNIFLAGMYFVEFGVHEASHIVFGFLPAVLVAAAGSLGEMTFTWLLVYASFRAKSYFAGIFSLLWAALAMTNAGMYMADARTQQLQLIGPGPDPQHDWHFVFSQLGWLEWDTFIGGTVRLAGDAAGLIGLIIGLVLLVNMASAQPQATASPVKKPT